MKFCALAVSTLAIATGVIAEYRVNGIAPQAISAAEIKAQESIDALKEDGCEVLGCVFSVADTVGSCAMALIDPSPITHIRCLAAVGKEVTNPPEECTKCV